MTWTVAAVPRLQLEPPRFIVADWPACIVIPVVGEERSGLEDVGTYIGSGQLEEVEEVVAELAWGDRTLTLGW